MNVTFRLANEELEKVFIKESTAAGLDGLKGHRAVGGMRASIYNAFPEEGVDALVAFMQEFERTTRVDAERLRYSIRVRPVSHVLASSSIPQFCSEVRVLVHSFSVSSSPPS